MTKEEVFDEAEMLAGRLIVWEAERLELDAFIEREEFRYSREVREWPLSLGERVARRLAIHMRRLDGLPTEELEGP